MTNVLTGLVPTLYEALHVVSREMVGFIPAVSRDSKASRAALNQIVRSPIAVAGALEDVTPGVNPAASGGTTVGFTDVSITKARAAPILWTGEEELSLTSGGDGTYNTVLADQFADGMRKIVNEIEQDLAVTAKENSSRAYGIAGTTPFGTADSLVDLAQSAKILKDNGAPSTDLQMVLNSAASANILGIQSSLFKVNEAGTSEMLRDGIIGRLQKFAFRESAGIEEHTKGTGTLYVTSGSTAVDVTDIALVTGSGTVLDGDVVTFAADTDNKYIIGTGIAAPGTISLGKPGARVVIATANAMTIGADYTGNFGFSRDALVLATRAPALPSGGDDAEDRMMITDPMTGLTFEVSVYRQYRQVKFEIAMAWGFAAPNPSHLMTLLG